MFVRHLSLLALAGVLTGCAAQAPQSTVSDGPADPRAPETPPPPRSTALDPSEARAELRPTVAGRPGTADPATSMGGGMNGLRTPGMGGGAGGDSAQPSPSMQAMPGMARESPRTAPAASPAAADYTCPMHSQVHLDHPGNCPICAMTLIKKDPAATAPKGEGQ